MATHSASEPPDRNRLFINTNDFDNCWARIRNTPVLVLLGPRGIGKRCTARCLIRKLMQLTEEKGSENCYFDINCSAADSSAAITAVYPLPEDQQFYSPSKLLLHTFKKINQVDSSLNKFILLDVTMLDAEIVVTDYLDHLLEEFVERMNEEQKNKWTILVAVTKVDEIKPAEFQVIGEDNFITFRGFADVKNVEEMIAQQYKDKSGAGQEYAKIIHSNLRLTLPIFVKVIVKDLRSYENPEEFSRRYMTTSRRNNAFNQHKTIQRVATLNIERCLEGSGIDVNRQRRFVAMLSLINGVEMPKELLAAFVECLPCVETYEASPIAHKLMVGLSNGDLCDWELIPQGVSRTFSVHPFHHETMEYFLKEFTEKERLKILKDVLVALICRMPKDGRNCDTEQIRCFYSHGVKVDSKVDEMICNLKDYCNDQFRSFMRILQSALLASMGYCLIGLRSPEEAERSFKRALNLYWEAVSGSAYSDLADDQFSTLQVATELYNYGQAARFTLAPVFEEYIKDISRLHVLTQNCQDHMSDVIEADDIVEEHLVPTGQDKLLRKGRLLHKPDNSGEGKVADVEKLAKVYMGELLVNIYCSWSKLYLRLHSLPGITLERSRGDFKLLAEIAMEICGLISEKHDVYLLQTLIAFRNLLRYELFFVSTCDEAKEIHDKWVGLSGRRTQVSSTRTEVFECGIVKCYVEIDAYHELSCMKGKLRSLGKMRAYAPDCTDLLKDAKDLMGDIKRKIELTSLKSERQLPDCNRDDNLSLCNSDPTDRKTPPSYHLAMSKALRVFAQYYTDCSAHADAVRCAIHSMEELRLSAGGQIDPHQLPFAHLLRELKIYSDHLPPFVQSTEPEAQYLQNVMRNIKPLRGNTQQGGGPHMEKLNDLSSCLVQRLAIEDGQCVQEGSGEDSPQGAAATMSSLSISTDPA